MMSENYHTINEEYYFLRYHLVWRPRFDLEILKDSENIIREAVTEVCRQYGYEMLSLHVRQEYIYLFLSTNPTVAPADAIQVLKNMTAVLLLKYFLRLKIFYSLYGSLWEKDYLVSTAFKLETETIRKYINQRKGR